MKIVVTGATGQLGLALKAVLPEGIYLSRRDLDLENHSQDIRRKVSSLKPDIVINTVAYTAVDEAEQNIAKAHQINGTAVRAIAQGCIDVNAYLFHLSSDYVFDIHSRDDHGEHEKQNPKSVYGRSKYVGETYLLSEGNCTIIRTSWLFGQGQNFVRTICAVAQQEREICVVSDQIGRPTYAFDLAAAIKQLTEVNDVRDLPSILHIQNEGARVSWAQYAREIISLAKLQGSVRDVSSVYYDLLNGGNLAKRPRSSVFDLSLMRSLGIAMPNWRSSLKKHLLTV